MYKLTLALRYFLKRKITYFAVLAVTLCVFIVVVVMTVTTDLYGEFIEKNHSFAGDCIVGTDSLVGFAYYEDFIKILNQQKEIAAVTPVIKNFALIRRRGTNEDTAVEIMGIDPNTYSRVSDFAHTLYYNRKNTSEVFRLSYDPNATGFVLGDSTISRDGDFDYRDKSTLPVINYSVSCFPLTAAGALARLDTVPVNTKSCYLSDLSNTGLPRVDGAIIYMPFDEVQKLCGMADSTKRISQIQIKFAPSVKINQGCELVRALWNKYSQEKKDESQAFLLKTVTVQSWKEFRRESIAPMENEQAELVVMFGFVGLTTVFIVLVVFYMIISHKSKDIGILKSIGVSKKNIIELFSFFAFLIGSISSVIGLFSGWLFLVNVNKIEGWLHQNFGFQLWNRDIYAIGDIPNRINLTVLGIVAAAAILACLLGAFFPSWQAARKPPADILQVNQL